MTITKELLWEIYEDCLELFVSSCQKYALQENDPVFQIRVHPRKHNTCENIIHNYAPGTELPLPYGLYGDEAYICLSKNQISRFQKEIGKVVFVCEFDESEFL